MTNEMLSDVNWFFVTLFVGAVSFGLVGFVGWNFCGRLGAGGSNYSVVIFDL